MTVDAAAHIVALDPGLAGQAVQLLGQGWDSTAYIVAGRVFKFPKSPAAAAALTREVAILARLDGQIRMTVPRPRLWPGPVSEHPLIPGDWLLSDAYDRLSTPQKDRLAHDLATFYADLHAIDPGGMIAAGAVPVQPWAAPAAMAAAVLPHLPADLQNDARGAIAAHAALPPDPWPAVYAYCDGHGWNMAFDHDAGRLNGIYDFADSGIAPLHRDFVYGSFISTDLTRRTMGAYVALTGRQVDRDRLNILTRYHRLDEIRSALAAPAGLSGMVANFRRALIDPI